MKKIFNVNLIQKIVYVGVLVLFSSCSLSVQKKYCKFEYTKKFKDDVVIPVLSKNLKEAFIYYAIESPAIINEGDKVKLIFSPTKQVDGNTLLSEVSFVIVVKSCSLEIIESYQAM